MHGGYSIIRFIADEQSICVTTDKTCSITIKNEYNQYIEEHRENAVLA
jgi:hypothetical protein